MDHSTNWQRLEESLPLLALGFRLIRQLSQGPSYSLGRQTREKPLEDILHFANVVANCLDIVPQLNFLCPAGCPEPRLAALCW